jgi:hypothetical protein
MVHTPDAKTAAMAAEAKMNAERKAVTLMLRPVWTNLTCVSEKKICLQEIGPVL